jgi:hypothetical protein
MRKKERKKRRQEEVFIMTCGFNAIFITWRIFLAANQNE